MKTLTVFALLALTLAACAPGMAAATETPVPTATSTPLSPTPTPILEATPTIVLPTMTLSSDQLTALVTTPDPAQEELFQEIKSVIEAYFDIRYQALSVEKPDGFRLEGFGDLVSDSPEAKAFVEAELGRLAVERKQKELYQLLFVEYEYSLDFESIALDTSSQVATVSVVEGYEVIVESGAESETQDPIVTRMGGLGHEIILHKEQGQWKIVSDDYTDNLWRWLRKSKLSADELLLTMQAPTKPALTSTP